MNNYKDFPFNVKNIFKLYISLKTKKLLMDPVVFSLIYRKRQNVSWHNL